MRLLYQQKAASDWGIGEKMGGRDEDYGAS